MKKMKKIDTFPNLSALFSTTNITQVNIIHNSTYTNINNLDNGNYDGTDKPKQWGQKGEKEDKFRPKKGENGENDTKMTKKNEKMGQQKQPFDIQDGRDLLGLYHHNIPNHTLPIIMMSWQERGGDGTMKTVDKGDTIRPPRHVYTLLPHQT